MQNETVTFDKLPEAVGYLTEQVIELKRMVSELQPPASDKHVLVEIEDACRIIRKAKPTIYTLVRKGVLPAYLGFWRKKLKKFYFLLTRKAKNSISTRTSCWHGLTTDEERLRNRLMRRCLPICKAASSISLNHPLTSNRLTYGYKFYQSGICH